MATRGIDLSDRSSKHLDVFLGEAFDYVISLCDRVREVCPDFLGGPRTIHWSIPDPAAEPVDETNPDAAFERTADELETRIRFLLDELRSETSAMEVTHV